MSTCPQEKICHAFAEREPPRAAFAEERNTLMNKNQFATMDGNEAVAYVAYRLNEVIAIYPITPASPMGRVFGFLVGGWTQEYFRDGTRRN